MKKYIFLAALVSAATMSTAAYADTAGTENSTLTYTWAGGESGKWNYSDANWSTGDGTTPVAYPEGTSADAKFNSETSVTVTEAINANSVSISANTAFNIEGTNSLSVGTQLNLGEQTLTKTGTGSLNLSGTTITGGVLEATDGVINVRNSGSEFSMASSHLSTEDNAMIKINGGTLRAQHGENGGSNVVTIGDVGISLIPNDPSPVFFAAEVGALFKARLDATLYIDIGKLYGDELSIAIIGQVVFEQGGFFRNILVGEWNEDGEWVSNRGWAAVFVEDTGHLKINPIPEPSAFGLLAGLGALAFVASRRRRK